MDKIIEEYLEFIAEGKKMDHGSFRALLLFELYLTENNMKLSHIKPSDIQGFGSWLLALTLGKFDIKAMVDCVNAFINYLTQRR